MLNVQTHQKYCLPPLFLCRLNLTPQRAYMCQLGSQSCKLLEGILDTHREGARPVGTIPPTHICTFSAHNDSIALWIDQSVEHETQSQACWFEPHVGQKSLALQGVGLDEPCGHLPTLQFCDSLCTVLSYDRKQNGALEPISVYKDSFFRCRLR